MLGGSIVASGAWTRSQSKTRTGLTVMTVARKKRLTSMSGLRPTEQSCADFAFVIPVGGGERPWLLQTLRSLRAQTASVCVAVCAVEDSPELQAALSEFSDIIDHVRIGTDGGQSDAINEGWAALRARFYGWLNDDDMLHPKATERALAVFDQGADVVHGQTDILSAGALKPGYGSRTIGPHILDDNTIAQPSTFVRRTALLSVDLAQNSTGYECLTRPTDPALHFTMDWDLWRRLYKAGVVFVATEQTLSITRWYEGTKSSALNISKYREFYAVIRRHPRDLRAAWTVVNTMVDNLARYGWTAPAFKPLNALLRALHARNVAQTESTPTNDLAEDALVFEVFHYADAVQTVTPSDTGKAASLPPGIAIRVTSGSARVSFD